MVHIRRDGSGTTCVRARLLPGEVDFGVLGLHRFRVVRLERRASAREGTAARGKHCQHLPGPPRAKGVGGVDHCEALCKRKTARAKSCTTKKSYAVAPGAAGRCGIKLTHSAMKASRTSEAY